MEYPACITYSANSSRNTLRKKKSPESISEEGKRKQGLRGGMGQWRDLEIQLICRIIVEGINGKNLSDTSATAINRLSELCCSLHKTLEE